MARDRSDEPNVPEPWERVTERERELLDLQQSLARTAQDWQRTIDALGFPILVLDAAGHVLEASASSRRLLEHSEEDILGRRVESLGDTPLWRGLVNLVAKLRSGEADTVSHQIESPDSASTWEVTAHRMAEVERSPAATLVTARDISRLVELQEAMARRETMEALGSLVAGVAHEVRNPVFAITARCESILNSVREEGDLDLALLTEDVEALMRSTRRLGSLMRALLEFGKPLTDSLQQGRPDQLLIEAVEDCAELAASCGVELKVRNEPVADTMLVDRPRVVTALRNLITNAIQYSVTGGQVAVALEVRRHGTGDGATAPKGSEARGNCRFVVEDRGRGFPPEDLPRLGTPFFSRRRGGTGLGLAIARRVADQFGGSLVVGNREQGGGRVVLTLPLWPATFPDGGSGLDQQGR